MPSLKLSKANGKLQKTVEDSYNLKLSATHKYHDLLQNLTDSNIMSFGIPAYRSKKLDFVTCPGAGACAGICYARQGAYLWGPRVRLEEDNLQLTFEADFAARMVELIANTPLLRIVRIHDSGDFYSQEYLEAWSYIASCYPERLFYAYTKSHQLDFSKLPVNFRICRSEGGSNDQLIDFTQSHSRIFTSRQDRVAAGYIDGDVSDLPAMMGKLRVGFVYHGVKKMTSAQLIQFSV